MSLIHTTRSAPFGAVVMHAAVTAAEALVGAVRAARRARATEKALAALTDRELADVGLHRGQIAEIARELARRG